MSISAVRADLRAQSVERAHERPQSDCLRIGWQARGKICACAFLVLATIAVYTLSDGASRLQVVNVTGQDWKCMADELQLQSACYSPSMAHGACYRSTVSSVDVVVSHIHAALSCCAQAWFCSGS